MLDSDIPNTCTRVKNLTCGLELDRVTALMSVCKQRPRAEMFSEEEGSYLEVTAIVQLTEAGFTKE